MITPAISVSNKANHSALYSKFIALLATGSLLGVAQGAVTLGPTTFADDFASPIYSFPNYVYWGVHYGGSNGDFGVDIRETSWDSSVYGLNLARGVNDAGTSPHNNANVIFKGTESIDAQLTDFKVSVALGYQKNRLYSNNAFGLVVRGQEESYQDTGGYFIALATTESQNADLVTLRIYDTPSGGNSHTGTTPENALAMSDEFTFSNSVFNTLEVTVIGNEITAKVLSLDGLSTLASVSYTDTREDAPEEGLLALRSSYGYYTSAYFKDLELEVIPVPEPSTSLLFGGMLLGIISHRRRRS